MELYRFDEDGLRWSIGDGPQIQVLHQPWLRNFVHKLLNSHPHSCVSSMVVSDLVVPQEKAWDNTFIFSLFLEAVAAELSKFLR